MNSFQEQYDYIEDVLSQIDEIPFFMIHKYNEKFALYQKALSLQENFIQQFQEQNLLTDENNALFEKLEDNFHAGIILPTPSVFKRYESMTINLSKIIFETINNNPHSVT